MVDWNTFFGGKDLLSKSFFQWFSLLEFLRCDLLKIGKVELSKTQQKIASPKNHGISVVTGGDWRSNSDPCENISNPLYKSQGNNRDS